MGAKVIVRCLCGKVNEECQLKDDVPVKGLLCHCNICRRVTGALTFSGCTLANASEHYFADKLTKFSTSKLVDRYFCSTCGSHVCYYNVPDGRWGICSGAIDEIIEGQKGVVEQLTGHEYVGDTGDGGLCSLLPNIPIYLEDDGQQPVNSLQDTVKGMQQEDAASGNQVKAECFCGQVSLNVRKASGDKGYEGAICACRSCRLAFSQPLPVYALDIPFDQITWNDGTVYDGSPHKSITRFSSSDHATRDFCCKCGAVVFYKSDKSAGKTDLAVGLVRAPDGALARSFISWNTDKIYHVEEAVDKVLMDEVAANLKSLG